MTDRLIVLISGRGSNLQAIQAACVTGQIPAQIAGVISNRPEAAGLAIARRAGLPTQVVDHRSFASREDFEAALDEAIATWPSDWIVLAGFMRAFTPGFVDRHRGRLVNIHPSLLPAFTGLHTHSRALRAGVCWHGATVHFVTAELDGGPIIAQAAVPVDPEDDEARLADKVLAAEHRLYPLALAWLCRGALELEGDRVHWRQSPPPQERSLLAMIPEDGTCTVQR
mgnify:FL=1